MDKAEVYISNETVYPSSEVFQWTMRKKKKSNRYSINKAVDPFILNDKNMIEYSPGIEEKKKKEYKGDSMAIKIDGDNWRHTKHICYLGFFNTTNEPLNATLTLTEYKEIDLIPKEVADKLACFDKLYNQVEGGTISQSERSSKKLVESQFTYGEILPIQFLLLLKIADPKPNSIFWDLGSGTAKTLVITALEYSDFKQICGVELLDGLYDAGVRVIDKYCEMTKTNKSKFKLVKGDMTKVDWTDADIIYTSSICFPEGLITELAEKGKALKPGTKIITLKSWGLPDTYKVLRNLKIKMTWGNNGVYILEKT